MQTEIESGYITRTGERIEDLIVDDLADIKWQLTNLYEIILALGTEKMNKIVAKNILKKTL